MTVNARLWRPTLLITDLDNTLYDFPAYYEAGLAAIVEELGTSLGLSDGDITHRLRAVYDRHQSIEYPFAIEEIPEVSELPEDIRLLYVRRALKTFWMSATASLTLYPSVLETLIELRRQRVPIVAYTDAPIHEATRRISSLGIRPYIVGIVAQQWFRRRPRRTFVARIDELPGFYRPSRRMPVLWRINERKPSSMTYEKLLSVFNLTACRAVTVGDSYQRDLRPAAQLGMTALWASYGHRDGSGEGLLQSVVPNRLPEVGLAYQPTEFPAFKIDKFADVISYLPVQQLLWI